MAIQKLKLHFPGDPPTFFCPVCGRKIFAEDSDEWCEHVVFAGETFSGEWIWNNPVYEEVFKKAADKFFEEMEDKEKYEDIEDYIADEGLAGVASIAQEAMESDSAFMMVISTYGMACGPVGGEVYAIVDYIPATAD